ncbi:MAG: hypothetical protein MRZ79_15920 [Bacteroidia bacterium]|nr:hypothetical protein [Bacteroidia bacterium]
MKKAFQFLILLLIIPSFALAQAGLTLEEAIAKKQAKVAVQGNGCYRGECLKIALKNLLSVPLTIKIPAGQIFISKDSSHQNLMVTEAQEVQVLANQSRFVSLTTMCIQSRNMSPPRKSKFAMGPVAGDHLGELAQLISDKEYQNSTAQSAVWAVANNDPIKYIYGMDTVMVKELAKIVSEATGSPMAEFRIVQRPHQITNINSSFEVFLEDYTEHLKLALYDSSDNLIRTYFDGRAYEPGFYQWKVGANHYMGENAKVYLRLFEGDKMLEEKLLAPSDTIQKLQRLNVNAVLNYVLVDEKNARVGVYDTKGRLYFLLKDNETLEEGYHRSTYAAKTYVLPDEGYFMKIISGEEVIASAKLDLKKKAEKIFPKQKKSGKFVMKLEEPIQNVKLGIYDEEGRLKRMMYEINSMSPGEKTFTYGFTHHNGPDANFYAKLTDANGKVVWEQKLD